jgi:vacuolar-type H+-ATPase subunit E/Vma4
MDNTKIMMIRIEADLDVLERESLEQILQNIKGIMKVDIEPIGATIFTMRKLKERIDIELEKLLENAEGNLK